MKKLLIVAVTGILLTGTSFARRGGGPRLTDEQKTCLDGVLGKREERTQRPSREEMDAALTKCGIEKPERGSREGRGNRQDRSDTQQN